MAQPAPAPPAAPKPILLTAAKVTKLTVTRGDTVRLAARSTTDDEIHVHGYDLMKDAPAAKTVRITFKATIEGIFEIEFETAGKQIAELRVQP